MNFFVGVVFFCLPWECSFWKAEKVFESKVECEKVVAKALDVFYEDVEVAAGACLKIKLVRV